MISKKHNDASVKKWELITNALTSGGYEYHNGTGELRNGRDCIYVTGSCGYCDDADEKVIGGERPLGAAWVVDPCSVCELPSTLCADGGCEGVFRDVVLALLAGEQHEALKHAKKILKYMKEVVTNG